MKSLARFDSLLARIEGLQREGKVREVEEILGAIEPREIPRACAAPFAELARRSTQHLLAIKFLNKIVRPVTPQPEPATGRELAAYGASLLALGAAKEAEAILAQVDADETPDAYLFRAFLFFAEWNYAGAIPILNRFIASAKISDYRRVVGQVNLCAAHVIAGNVAQAEELLNQVQGTAKARGFNVLLGNLLEIHSQLHILRQDYDKALLTLKEATSLLAGASGWNEFLVKKWNAICRLMISQGDAATVRELSGLRREAISLKHWETLRDLDLFQALATRDQSLLDHLIIGTPFPDYRKRVANLFGGVIQIPKEFDWLPFEAVSPVGSPVLDVSRGTAGDDVGKLVHQPSLHRALVALTRDFYKPSSLGLLFSLIYPGEYFDPITSPARVLKTLYRLNDFFQSEGLPLSVLTTSGDFQLKATGPIRLRLRWRQSPKSKIQFLLAKLHKDVGPKSFDSQKVTQVLRVSKTSASRVIAAALKTKRVVKIGNGRSTRYRFSRARSAA